MPAQNWPVLILAPYAPQHRHGHYPANAVETVRQPKVQPGKNILIVGRGVIVSAIVLVAPADHLSAPSVTLKAPIRRWAGVTAS